MDKLVDQWYSKAESWPDSEMHTAEIVRAAQVSSSGDVQAIARRLAETHDAMQAYYEESLELRAEVATATSKLGDALETIRILREVGDEFGGSRSRLTDRLMESTDNTTVDVICAQRDEALSRLDTVTTEAKDLRDDAAVDRSMWTDLENERDTLRELLKAAESRLPRWLNAVTEQPSEDGEYIVARRGELFGGWQIGFDYFEVESREWAHDDEGPKAMLWMRCPAFPEPVVERQPTFLVCGPEDHEWVCRKCTAVKGEDIVVELNTPTGENDV